MYNRFQFWNFFCGTRVHACLCINLFAPPLPVRFVCLIRLYVPYVSLAWLHIVLHVDQYTPPYCDAFVAGHTTDASTN